MGGYIAAEVSMEKKNLLEKLVLIDSSGMIEKATPLLEEYPDTAMNPTKYIVRKVFEHMVADPTRILSKLIEDFIIRITYQMKKFIQVDSRK